MMDFMLAAYPWLKALHIISVIAWMAGMLYLPRLFVYHAEAAPGSALSETFKIMERKLLRLIMRPAMLATLLFGVLLVGVPGLVDHQQAWLPVKLLLVAGLLAAHGMMARWTRAFAEDANKHPARFFRLVNEVPTVLMIGIVFLVVVKPF
ncbi:MAG TPA: protoporphyrinogen oxidase HemJ [Stellaceae bacterium]|nr:protoporphyrinogen oxidase HemJ [Stellaceae bacterium]